MAHSFDPRTLADFARYHGFHYDLCDPRELVKDLLVEMDRGLSGDESTLPMLPSYITPVASLPVGKRTLALDAGGTNLRGSIVRVDEKGALISEEQRKAPMPGTKGRVNAKEFFSAIADVAAPLLQEAPDVEGIGFCFSYPTETQSDADGILLEFSKEVDAPDVVGKKVGAELRSELARRGIAVPDRLVLLNDTTAALLSGIAEIPADGRTGSIEGPGGPVIGFILGTGMNVAYPETKIPKINFDAPRAPQVVVCESGNFKSRYTGRLDAAYDRGLKNPGAYTMEKTMAGAYLGGLALFTLKRAIQDGVLAMRNPEAILELAALPTLNVTAFLRSPFGGEGILSQVFSSEDREAASAAAFLLAILVERAGMFSAATVAAAAIRTDGGYDPLSPLRVAVEGTTFMVVRGLRTAFEAHLHRLLSYNAPRSLVISPVEQASLFGAAVAAFSA